MYTGVSSAQHSQSPVRMFDQQKFSLDKIQSVRDGIFTQNKKRGNTVEAVSVHVMKLEDLPEPLSRREFREICQREGIPVTSGGTAMSKHTIGDNFFDQCRDSQALRMQERWNNTVSNLFGAYLKVFDLFKSWHSSIIQQRHFGPENVEQHVASKLPRPPFKNPIKPNLSKTETQHVIKQKKLVNLLIQYGIGLSYSEAVQDRAGTADIKINSGQQTLRNPSPLGSHQYGPTVSKQMIFEQLSGQSAYRGQANHQSKHNSSNLQIPMANTIPMRDQKTRRFSFAVSDNDSRNVHSAANSDNGKDNSVMVDVDIQIRNNDDFEHFDVQDEIQIAQNAAERLRLITAPPEGTQERSIERNAHKLKKDFSQMRGGVEEWPNGPCLTDKELNNEKEFFSPMHMRLRKELLETRQKLQQIQTLLENSEKRNVLIISKHNKEEVDRTVFANHIKMPYPEQADAIRSQIESKFYNVADGLEPHIVEILNQKLAQIKDYFIGQIQLISHHSESLRQNVALMESMNKDGIKFSDMDTENLIERVSDIERQTRDQNAQLRTLDPSSRLQSAMNRPQSIWNMLQTHFGQDYFLEVIEEEYGIAPGANEFFAKKIEQHFDNQITGYKVEQHRMQAEYDDQVTMLKNELQELTEQNGSLMRQDQKRQEKMTHDLRQNLNSLYMNREEALIKTYKSKLNQREETIVELNHERDNKYRSFKSVELNYWFKKIQMFSLVSKLIKNVETSKRTKIDYKVLKMCEKFVTHEKIILRYSADHDVPPQIVKDEMYQNKILKWKRKFEESEANFGWHSNRAEFNAARIEEYRCELERLNVCNIELKLKLPQLAIQAKLFQESLTIKEKENEVLIMNVKKIEERWKNQMKESHKFTAKTIIAALELKSNNEMSAYLARAGLQKSVRGHKGGKQNAGTITSMQNTRIAIESVRLRESKEVDHKEVQVKAEVDSIHVQTEFVRRGIDVASGKDRDFTLRSRYIQCDDATGKQFSESKQMLKRSGTFADWQQPPNTQPGTSTNRLQKQKSSFTKPHTTMKKAQSTVLGSKEFIFNNTSRGANNISQMSKDVKEETRSNLSNTNLDSSGKMLLTRRNTIHNTKMSANQRFNNNISSQNDQSKDSKIALRRQTTVVSQSKNMRSEDQSPDHSNDNLSKKSKLLQRGKTVESMTLQSKEGENTISNQKDFVRQTIAGVNSQNTSSEKLVSNLTSSKGLRQSQRFIQRESDLGPKQKQSSPILSQSKLDISQSKTILKIQKGSKDKLGISKKGQIDSTTRLTSAVVKQSPLDHNVAGNLRNTLGKQQSKRELKNPSMLRPEAQVQNGRGRTKQQSSMVFANKNNSKLLKDSKDGLDMSRLTRQTHGGLATLKSNKSSNKKNGMKSQRATSQYNSQLPQGVASNYMKVNVGALSPTSQNIVSGGEEVLLKQGGDSSRTKGYPKLLVNSFGDLAGNVTSPLQCLGQGEMQEYTSGQNIRERNTEQMATENSAINLNFMEAKFNMQSAEGDQAKGADNAEYLYQGDNNQLSSPDLVEERNMAKQIHRPTTVQDVSKDYSPSQSRHSPLLVVGTNTTNNFSHLTLRKETVMGQEGDICSTVSIQSKGADGLPIVETDGGVGLRPRLSARRAKNLSQKLSEEFNADRVDFTNKEKRHANSLVHSTLFNGGQTANQGKLIEDPGQPSHEGSNIRNSQHIEGKRLTRVQEQDIEYLPVVDSIKSRKESGRQSNKHKQNSNQSLVEFTQKIASKEDYLGLSGHQSMSSHQISEGRSSQRSSLNRHPDNLSAEKQRNAQKLNNRSSKYKSFATDQDSSDYSHKKNPPIDQICNLIQSSQKKKDPIQQKQSRIQKLLLKGYINEEQFICLQLLEKGYIPSSPGDAMQQASTEQRRNEQYVHKKNNSNNQRGQQRNIAQRFASATNYSGNQQQVAQTMSINTVSSGFYKHQPKGIYSSSGSPSRSRSHKRGISRGFIEKTYRIYPKKIPELEKIFNRVYQNKREIGTQCNNETAANALMDGAVQEQTEKKARMSQTSRIPINNPPKSSQLHHKFKRVANGSQPKTGRVTGSRRNSKDFKTQAHSSTQYPFSTMHSIGEKIELMGQQAFPLIQSQAHLNPLQNSGELFQEKGTARFKWVNAIPVQQTEPSQHQIQTQAKKTQRIHKLRKNHGDQVKIMQSMATKDHQRANVLTSCSQRVKQQVPLHVSTPELVSGYKTNQSKAPHNLIVPAGHGQFIAHAINGRQTAPPKRVIQGIGAAQAQSHPYLAQNVPKS